MNGFKILPLENGIIDYDKKKLEDYKLERKDNSDEFIKIFKNEVSKEELKNIISYCQDR